MSGAAARDDEAARLRSLDALALVGEAADERVQRLVRMTRQAFAAPHALVSLVLAQTQHLWCQAGTPLADIPRELGFCSHTIGAEEVLWVSDARTDVRFADSPLVRGGPGIRFYAGAPLHAPDGARIGALCVIDTAPRGYDAGSAQLLADLAACIDEDLKRRGEQQLRQQLARERQRLAQIIDATRVGTWEWHMPSGTVLLGSHWGETLGHTIDTAAPATYETWARLVHPDDLPHAQARLQACLRGEDEDYACEYRMRHQQGGWRWMQDRGRVVARDATGRPQWMAGTHSDITEHKNLELALAAQAEFLRQIIETSASALLVCDAEGRVRFRNPAGRRLLTQLRGDDGASPRAVHVVLPPFLAADGGALAAAAQPIAAVLHGEQRLATQQLALRDTAGRLLPLLVDAAPLGAAVGSDRTVLLSLRDVSLLARREQQLEWEQRRFRSLVDSTQGIVWEADPETGTFRYVSQQAERLLGFRAEDWLLPGFWAAHLHPDDRERTVDFCRLETAARRNHTFDYRMLAADGRVVWLRDFVTVATDIDGAPTLRGIMIDVSAEYLADAALKEARSTLRLALRAGGIGTWQVDLAAGSEVWDTQMWQLVGIGEDASPEARDLAMASLALAGLAEGAAVDGAGEDAAREVTRTIRRADSGETRQLRIAASVVADPSGAPRLLGTAWDCSSYSQRETALRERQEALQQLVEAQTLSAVQARHRAERAAALQSEFLANVSHELRTPLHAILGFLALAIDELGDSGELARGPLPQRIGKAHAAAGRLLGLVDDLLDLAKLESGHNTLTLAPTSLETILDTVVDELQPLHSARGLTVLRRPAAAPAPVLADAQRVGQVFRNVLANASRFSPERGHIEISLRAEEADGECWLDVCVLDEGPGIPDGEQEQIFDKFVQSSRSVQGRASGTGLGLPIAREIMRAHGGDIRAENRAGGGALFRIRFPRIGERDIEALR